MDVFAKKGVYFILNSQFQILNSVHMSFSISLIIPAFNEEKRIRPVLESLRSWSEKAPSTLRIEEIIIVDDGSTDGTVSCAKSFSSLPIRLHTLDGNRGKGRAIKEGIMLVTGTWVLLFDADGATSIDELVKLTDRQTASQAPIVIGSRILDSSAPVSMQWYRRMIGWMYHVLTSPLIPGIRDASCGFKLIRTDIAILLFQDVQTNGYGYDVEFLALAHQQKIPIEEVQVHWIAIPGSKVHVLGDGLRMFLSACALYLRFLFWGKKRPEIPR
jgi:dolichyl-phosphate beta-glucosyltransferase